MKKSRLEESKFLAQGHAANKWRADAFLVPSLLHHTMLPILHIASDGANHIRIAWDAY